MSRRPVALFDFCATLTNFQTADPFVDFVLQGRKTPGILLKDCVRSLLFRARLLRNERHKLFKLGLLRSFPKELLQREALGYVEQRILPNVRRPVLDRLLEHKRNGDYVVILSAGYEIYLSPFAERFGVDKAIGTRIRFTDDRCDGVFSGSNCRGPEKVRRFKAEVAWEQFDLTRSTAYGDEPSDLPMLELVGRKVIVSEKPDVPWRPSDRYSILRVAP